MALGEKFYTVSKENAIYVASPVISMTFILLLADGIRAFTNLFFLFFFLLIVLASLISVACYSIGIWSRIHLSLLTLVNIVLLGHGIVKGMKSYGFGLLAGLWILYVFIPLFLAWFSVKTYEYIILKNSNEQVSNKQDWNIESYQELYGEEKADSAE